MRKLLSGLLLLLAGLIPAGAMAQYPSPNPQTVYQSGGVGSQITPRHPAMWITNGVIGDAGPAAGGPAGTGLSELGITNMGLPFCINDQPITSGNGYHQLCLGANSLGGGLLSYQSYGGANQLPFNLNINGTLYPFPGPGGGNVIGPTSPAPGLGDPVIWNGGTTVRDGGTPINILAFGADPTGTNDNSAAFTAGFAAACGKSLFVPAGLYIFTASPADPHCGFSWQLDPNAVLDTSAIGTGAYDSFIFSGTEGTPQSLTVDAVPGATSITVASSSGFCAAATNTPDPACATLISSNATWDPTRNSHHVGELRLIKSISGNVLTVFGAIEGTYNVADSAIALPVAMIDGMQIRGGQFKGPPINNAARGITIKYGYRPKILETVFYNYGGLGGSRFWNTLFYEEAHTIHIGIGSASSIVAYAVELMDAVEYGDIHDIQCYNSGPCVTLDENNPPIPGNQRHTRIHHNYAFSSTQNTVEIAFQTHYACDDTEFSFNTVYYTSGIPNSSGLTASCLNVRFLHNYVLNPNNAGIDIDNQTNVSGYVMVNDNFIQGGGNSTFTYPCILVNTEGVPGLTSTATSGQINGNTLQNCFQDGIVWTQSFNAATPSNLMVANNNVISYGRYCIYVDVTTNGGGVVNNTCDNVPAAAGIGILLLNPVGFRVTNNTIKAQPGFTGFGIDLDCAVSSPGNYVGENIFISPSDVSGTAIDLQSGCVNSTVGAIINYGMTTTALLNSDPNLHISSPLTGVTGSIGGSPVAGGACATGTGTVSGATTNMSASAGPRVGSPGAGFFTSALVTGPNTVTVSICNFTSGSLTPTARVYNLGVWK